LIIMSRFSKSVVILVGSTNYELVGGTTAKIKVGRGTGIHINISLTLITHPNPSIQFHPISSKFKYIDI